LREIEDVAIGKSTEEFLENIGFAAVGSSLGYYWLNFAPTMSSELAQQVLLALITMNGIFVAFASAIALLKYNRSNISPGLMTLAFSVVAFGSSMMLSLIRISWLQNLNVPRAGGTRSVDFLGNRLFPDSSFCNSWC
jgi:hypothetical protein